MRPMRDVKKSIKNTPTINPWIDAKKEKPEPGKYVICSCYGGFFDVLKWDSEDNSWRTTFARYFSWYVLYWMPLPEPPKEANHAEV